MAVIEDNYSRLRPEVNTLPTTRYTLACPTKPESFASDSFLDDLSFSKPLDLVEACYVEIMLRNPGKRGYGYNSAAERLHHLKLAEDSAAELVQTEMYSMPRIFMANIERLLSDARLTGDSISDEIAISALIRHSFENQNYSCRLKRWWVDIRQAIMNREQSFESPRQFNKLYAFISEYKSPVPDFGGGRKNRKFRIRENLLRSVSKVAQQLGFSVSEYCQRLIMRSLSECEGIEFADEIRQAVIEDHKALEERIRLIVANIKALRIKPCERLAEAINEVNLDDYLQS